MSYIICLPTFGAPYLWEGKTHSKIVETCRKVVQGTVEKMQPGGYNWMVIHPMFCNDNPRWALAQKILDAGCDIYVNEDGRNMCCPNMACLSAQKQLGGMVTKESFDAAKYQISRVPYFGDVALVISKAKFEALADPEGLILIEEAYEPEDEEETEAKKKECEENGWDFGESTGQIYKKKMAAPAAPKITIRRKKTTAAAVAGAKAAVAKAKSASK